MSTLRNGPASRPRTPLRCTNQLTNREALQILVEHVHDRSEKSCVACGYICSPERPNCPTVARALRWLAEHPQRLQQSLTKAPYDVLYRLVREHRPNSAGTRCTRCGLAYGNGRRECPTLRNVYRELAGRGDLRDRQRQQGRAICAGSNQWQVDTHSDRTDWKRAIDLCRQCPMLATCRNNADKEINAGTPPRSLIMGGLLFDSRGNVIPEKDFALFDRRRNGLTRRTRVRKSRIHEADFS
ncbi:hypothetical protein [Nocardia nova]|uniref:hypothetical protein n=1 Tax=Nocardia nova TaxID=37330 RepID=UPI0033E69600